MIILISFVLTVCACKIYSPLDDRIKTTGRYYVKDSSINYDWPCFRVQFCFHNSSQVLLHIKDSWNIYRIIIDQNQTHTIHPKLSSKVSLFKPKDLLQHCIKIIKITQNHYGPLGSFQDSRISGVQLVGDSSDLVSFQRSYDYKLQFIGDSDTNGFGILTNNTYLCPFRMKSIQNCMESWATHLSEKLNAEYQMEAYSGKGVYVNSWIVPGRKMPSFLTKVTTNSEILSYKFPQTFIPDAVIVQLGHNDFANVSPPTLNNFVEAYTQMMSQVTDQYWIHNKALPKIINLCNPWVEPKHCQYVRLAAEAFAKNYKKSYYIELPKDIFSEQDWGCLNHINFKGQRKISQYLHPIFERILRQS